MRKCRNWQTSKTKDLVAIAVVWVQVPSSAWNEKTQEWNPESFSFPYRNGSCPQGPKQKRQAEFLCENSNCLLIFSVPIYGQGQIKFFLSICLFIATTQTHRVSATLKYGTKNGLTWLRHVSLLLKNSKLWKILLHLRFILKEVWSFFSPTDSI